ncbi:MAG: hypothetical protein M3Y53_11505 [Thermoproteota archaeon]|nr:hypothetical protein [Thermoproteota archaeon]
MSSKSKDNDGDNCIKDTEKEHNKTSVVELLDAPISHLNAIRSVFKVMMIILAPLSLMFAAILVIHLFFIQRILFRFPDIGVFLLFFIGVSIMLASMWFYIGLSEQRFFSNWDKNLVGSPH